MRSKIFSSDHMRASSKGQMWIPVFLSLGFLLAFPVAELLKLGNWFGMNYEPAQIEMLYENLWRDGLMATGFTVIFLAAVINGINGFWYLYSRKKVDFYHGLPITRKKLFWYKTGMGILYYLIPYTVCMFMALCIGAMRGFYSLKLLGMAGSMLAGHFLMYLLVYFVTVLAVCVTGNILMGALVLGGILLYGPLLAYLLIMYTENFFTTGYSYEYGIYRLLTRYGSPAAYCMSFIEDYAKGGFSSLFLLLPFGAALTGCLAYYAYKMRRSERTGKPVVYKWLEVVVKFLAVIPTGLGCGMIFYLIPEGNQRIAWWIFGLILGTVLSHGVMEILYHMDFRGFFASKLQLAAAGAAVALAASCFQFDLLHFNTYLPPREKLVSLNIDMEQSLKRENWPYLTEEGGKYTSVSWSDPSAGICAEEKGTFDEGIYEALSSIVKKQNHVDLEENSCDLPVKYTLAGGRSLYRSYQITEEELKNFLLACWKEGTVTQEKYAFLDLSVEYLTWVSGSFADGSTYALFQNDHSKYQELTEALKADILEAKPEELVGTPCASLNFQYDNVPEPEKNMLPYMDTTMYCNADIFVYPTFKRTLAILGETGYPLSLEEVQVVSAEVYFYSEEGELLYKTEYQERNQLEAVKASLRPGNLIPEWEKIDHTIEVNFTTSSDSIVSYGYFLKNAIPDFIEKDRAANESNSEA